MDPYMAIIIISLSACTFVLGECYVRNRASSARVESIFHKPGVTEYTLDDMV